MIVDVDSNMKMLTRFRLRRLGVNKLLRKSFVTKRIKELANDFIYNLRGAIVKLLSSKS